jgi:hypothetical protein
MSEDPISRDECRQRVGEKFYGEALAGPASDEEWKLTREHGPEQTTSDGISKFEIIRPSSPEIADALARAVGRNVIALAQERTIDYWLAIYGFDVSRHKTFRRAAFEAAMDGPLGQALAQVRAQHVGTAQAATDMADASQPSDSAVPPPGAQDSGSVSTSPPLQEALIDQDMKDEPLGVQMAVAQKRSGNPGRVQWRRPAIVKQMQDDLGAGRITREKLEGLNQEALAVQYGANRETVVKARDEALHGPLLGNRPPE